MKVLRLASLFATCILMTSCSSDDSDQTREAAVRPVKLITIEGTSSLETLRFPAVVGASQISDLSFPVGGQLIELSIKESQQVEEGDVIARLDQRDFASNVSSAKAQFANAEDEYQRAVRLSREDAIARSVVEQRQTQRDVAKSQLDSAEKALEDTILRAPFSGVIAQVAVRRQKSVSPGATVVTLMGVGGAEATINVPARVIAESQNREDRGVSIILDVAPGRRFPAVLKEATLLADATAQTYAVTFSFELPEGLIVLPGMTATIETSTAVRYADAEIVRVSVPLSAIGSDGAGRYVWVVSDDTMTVSRRDVAIEDGIGDTVVISEGLEPGEMVVGAGASYLAEGMTVRAWTD